MIMAAQGRESAILATMEYYRIKYPVRAERIAALRGDYLAAFESKGASIGKTLSGSGADGVNTTFLISLSTEEQLAVLATTLRRLEGRSANAVKLYAR